MDATSFHLSLRLLYAIMLLLLLLLLGESGGIPFGDQIMQ